MAREGRSGEKQNSDDMKASHGGKRKGSGRKLGRNVQTGSITLPPELWEKLDRMRGTESRGAFLASKIQRMREV